MALHIRLHDTRQTNDSFCIVVVLIVVANNIEA